MLLCAEHQRYIGEVAALAPPENIEPLLRVLQAQGHTLVSPQERRGLHPLLIPLACSERPETPTANAALTGTEVYTCLLRWPEPQSDSLPLVRASRNAPSVMHAARSIEEYLHRHCPSRVCMTAVQHADCGDVHDATLPWH